MQIDELPAGEQTRHPDLDMNQVVGTHDILMLCFDTLRYDVSKEEEAAGRTPVLNSHGGEWEKRHAPGNFTYPSHFAIFAGFLPSPAEPHSLRSRNWLFFPVQAGTGRIPPKGSYPFTEATFVQSLAHTGYETICIGGVNFFSKRNELGRVFPGYFTKSYWLPTFGCTAPDSTEKQIDFALKKLENYPDDINGSADFYNKADYGIIVERDKEVGVTRVYVDKVKFKHLGVGGMASFVYDPVSGRYLPCEESHDPSLSADQRVRNTMFDNSCWLPEKELFKSIRY